ncbi:MAG: WhiB family transcriptional regulator [Demequina sp.]|uniref:WhiB family transcriptional regulator n=1 Tax=Demequina sp. TaxID=2050685 RepID=UPI003A894B41
MGSSMSDHIFTSTETVTPMAWADQALCAQVDQDLFFPEQGEPNTAAKRVCGLCPVTTECLAYALAHREPHGVWGGLSVKQREALNREIARQGAPRRGDGSPVRRRGTA